MQPSTFTHLTFLMPLQIYSLHSNQIVAFLKVSLPFLLCLIIIFEEQVKMISFDFPKLVT